MKYNHVVKYKGVWYPAGADVPNETAPVEVREPAPVVTRTEIQQMRKAELLALAEKEGIPTDEDTTVAWLKTTLLKHFGL